jgi:hypothetical protein
MVAAALDALGATCVGVAAGWGDVSVDAFSLCPAVQPLEANTAATKITPRLLTTMRRIMARIGSAK